MNALQNLTLALSTAAVATLTATAALAGSHVDGQNFKLDATSSACTAGAECTVIIKLEATGEYHINKSYPYKFKASDAAGVEYLGTDTGGKNLFTKVAGNFAEQGEKAATMTIKFKPAAKGTVTIAGTYKMSVCSSQNCQLETQELSVTVPVK